MSDCTGRPLPTEYAPFFERYVSLVPEEAVLPVLAEQPARLRRALAAVGETGAGYRYAEGKWSIRQVLGHLADTERIMACRALRFARGEKAALAGFDENAYVREAAFDGEPLVDLVAEFALAREGHVLLLRHLPPAAWRRAGVADGQAVTVRGLAYIMAGHVRHHLGVLRERYGVGPG